MIGCIEISRKPILYLGMLSFKEPYQTVWLSRPFVLGGWNERVVFRREWIGAMLQHPARTRGSSILKSSKTICLHLIVPIISRQIHILPWESQHNNYSLVFLDHTCAAGFPEAEFLGIIWLGDWSQVPIFLGFAISPMCGAKVGHATRRTITTSKSATTNSCPVLSFWGFWRVFKAQCQIHSWNKILEYHTNRLSFTIIVSVVAVVAFIFGTSRDSLLIASTAYAFRT